MSCLHCPDLSLLIWASNLEDFPLFSHWNTEKYSKASDCCPIDPG